jgi:nucleoid DNA-binding protein
MANVARLATRQRAFIARCQALATKLTGVGVANDEVLNEAYNFFILQIMSDLRKNGTAELPGIGTFRLSKDPGRKMSSPLTGEVVIPAHTKVRYKSEKTLHRMVNSS